MATETRPFRPPPTRPPRGPWRTKRIRPADALFHGFALAAVLIALGALAWLLISILSRACGALDWGFLTDPVSTNPDTPGFDSALRGSFVLMIITFAVAIPIGFAAAIYLEKFAAISREQLHSAARGARAPAARAEARAGASGPRSCCGRASVASFALGADRPADQPRHRGQHLEPRRRALDHLRPARPGPVRDAHRPQQVPARRRADPGAARAADHHHRQPRGDPGGAGLDRAGRDGARRHAVAGGLAPGRCRRPCRGCSPGRSSPCRARSARRPR